MEKLLEGMRQDFVELKTIAVDDHFILVKKFEVLEIIDSYLVALKEKQITN